MYATVRRYVGNPDLANQLADRPDDVRSVIGGVQGLQSFYLLRAGNDTVTITITESEAGGSESVERARAYMRENLPDAAASPPEVSSGEVLVQL